MHFVPSSPVVPGEEPAKQRGQPAATPVPIGQVTPVPPTPQ